MNMHIREIVDAAEAAGWQVLAIDLESPGYVTLVDGRNNRVEVRSEHGLDTVRLIRAMGPPPGRGALPE